MVETGQQQPLEFLFYYTQKYIYIFKIYYNQLAFRTSHMTPFHHFYIYQMSTTKEQNVSLSKIYGITQALLSKYHFGLC